MSYQPKQDRSIRRGPRFKVLFKMYVIMAWPILSILLSHHTVRAQDRSNEAGQSSQTARQIIEHFQNSWDEAKWEKEFRVTPEKYMRASDDKQWQHRFSAFHQLVLLGDQAVPELLKALQSDHAPVRILAAQTIGFLGSNAAQTETLEELLEAAKSDTNAAVRLYAIDSYGMLGGKADRIKDMINSEPNRDVKMHIKYAMERNGEKFSEKWLAGLADVDLTTIDSAIMNEPAPDFTLKTVTGETISLSDFREKSHVILVFIYGDT